MISVTFDNMIRQHGPLPKNDAARRATVFARLIEEFCLTSVLEAITDEDANTASTLDDTAERMADAFVEIMSKNGGRLPGSARQRLYAHSNRTLLGQGENLGPCSIEHV